VVPAENAVVPPTYSVFSSSSTLAPCSAPNSAADMPAPTTTMSKLSPS